MGNRDRHTAREIKIDMTALGGKNSRCFFDTTIFQIMGSYDAETLLICITRTWGNLEIFVAVVPSVFLEEIFKKFVVIHQVEWFLRDVTPYQFSHCSAVLSRQLTGRRVLM